MDSMPGLERRTVRRRGRLLFDHDLRLYATRMLELSARRRPILPYVRGAWSGGNLVELACLDTCCAACDRITVGD